MPQFILKITLGNDAMCRNADDIGEALKHYGSKIRTTGNYDCGDVFDQNGNAVGHYEVTE